MGSRNSNTTQYERNRCFGSLVFAVARTRSAAKLSSVGLRLNASKSESLLDSEANFSTEIGIGLWAQNYVGLRAVPEAVLSCILMIPPAEKYAILYRRFCERGIVSSRVALLRRSAEIKPLFTDVFYTHTPFRHSTLGVKPLERDGGVREKQADLKWKPGNLKWWGT